MKLRQKCGLLGNEPLLRDYEERKDEVGLGGGGAENSRGTRPRGAGLTGGCGVPVKLIMKRGSYSIVRMADQMQCFVFFFYFKNPIML